MGSLLGRGRYYVLCYKKKDSRLCEAADAAEGDCPYYHRGRYGRDGDEQTKLLLSFS